MDSKVMGRPEEERMHHIAKDVAQYAIEGLEQHMAKEKSIAVAIERHNFDWREGFKFTHERFLWIKAREKVKVKEVKDSYLSNHWLQYRQKGIRVTFRVDGQIPDDDIRLADLNTHNDKFVVFTTQTPASISPALFTSSPPSGVETAQSFLTSTPRVSNLDPSLDASKTSSIESPSHATSYTRYELPKLPHTTTDTAVAMEPNVQEDTSPTLGHYELECPMMQDENAPLSHGTLDKKARGQLPDGQTEQYGQPDLKFSETLAKTNDPTSPDSGYKPRPVPDIFRSDEPVADELVEDVKTCSQTSLQHLLQDPSPERLEAAVKNGSTVLSAIEDALSTIRRNSDAQKWLEQIDSIRKPSATRNRTVIGVVGNTGAGKSSVINAILDEERLVPTNCMRACTAVVTEISYNESPSAQYRAEIEFIQPEDWRRELTVLFKEVFDKPNSISKEALDPDSDAGVAWAKIRAVYNKYTKAMLQKSTVEDLMDVPSIKSILGTVKRINGSECASFYQRLQHYVDSQQTSGGDGKKIKRVKREPQLWPLIKVVRIYTKADALSTGAVIVDLPGVHDSNAARAAVAEGYIKECTGLWIVAPIARAVDDKAAKNLLGTTFKRQLKYDGAYSAVTFICSKTDDISRTEATDSLQLGAEMAELENERDEIDRKRQEAIDQQESKRADKAEQDELVDEYDDEIGRLEDYISSIETNQSSDAVHHSKKRLNRSDVGKSEETTGSDTFTAQQAHDRIKELNRARKKARQHSRDLADEIKALQKHLSAFSARRTKNNEEADVLCIKGRNEWSRRRIRDDFAEGIKDMDQENAAEESPDNFDPEEELRDYDKVAQSLPVFCVSSRAYQRLSNRLLKDGDVNGFTLKDQTEIPQLQAHCRKLTEAGRQASCRSFLNSLSQLLTSLSLWASDDGNSADSSKYQHDMMKVFVETNLHKLQQALQVAVSNTMDDVEQVLSEQLVEHLSSAANAAASMALTTSASWGAPRDQGGLFWATYKAIVRRGGIFQGSSGSRNFNNELTEPLYKDLGSWWERTFQRRLPEILIRFPLAPNTLMKNFHNAVEEKCKQLGFGVFRVARLRDNVVVLETAFNEVANSTISNLNEGQREINREFTPAITTAMSPVYEKCSDESGPGSFARMKNFMRDHVSAEETAMFENAIQTTMQNLATMCAQTRATFSGRVERMYQTIERDYLAVVGAEPGKNLAMGGPERTARQKVEDAISESEEIFSRVLGCDIGQLKVDEVSEADESMADADRESDIEDATQPLAALSSDDNVESEEDKDDDEDLPDMPFKPR